LLPCGGRVRILVSEMRQKAGLVTTAEYNGASAVLSAAALTYVAALLAAVAK
jgi:Zn-dependent membrane protease YugP